MEKILFYKINAVIIPEYVFYALNAFKSSFDEIVIIVRPEYDITSSELNSFGDYIVKANDSLEQLCGNDNVKSFMERWDYVCFIDDSFFGPVFDLSVMFDRFGKSSADFMTSGFDSLNTEYFLFIKRSAANLISFFNFSDEAYIHNLLNNILNNGLKQYFLYEDDKKDSNIDNYMEVLLNTKFPFIKINDLVYNSINPRFILDSVRNNSQYPIELIESYIFSKYNPNVSYKLFQKTVFPISTASETDLSIAVHIHVYYPDILEKFLLALSKNKIKYTLFITTDNENKKLEITKILDKFRFERKDVQIIITANIGRDVWPWLSISDQLSRYDIAGHFHTKKSPHKYSFKGQAWTDEIISSIMSNMKDIISIFAENKKIGVVIPDIPDFYKFISAFDVLSKDNRELCNELWSKMFSEADEFNFFDINTPIMPYGNMFWYRPQALKAIMDMKIKETDIPVEPLPIDGTLLHAIERLPVYVAWKQGFDFRVVLNKEKLVSGFDYRMNGLCQNAIVRAKALVRDNADNKCKGTKKSIIKKILCRVCKNINYILLL